MKLLTSTGTFQKHHRYFVEGLKDLNGFESIKQVLHGAKTENQVISRLATNAGQYRPQNDVWGKGPKIKIAPDSIEYITASGLTLGWKILEKIWFDPGKEVPGAGGNSWLFYVTHPAKRNISATSELRKEARKLGWLECYSDGTTDIPFISPDLKDEGILGIAYPKPGKLWSTDDDIFNSCWVSPTGEICMETFTHRGTEHTPTACIYGIPRFPRKNELGLPTVFRCDFATLHPDGKFTSGIGYTFPGATSCVMKHELEDSNTQNQATVVLRQLIEIRDQE